MESNGVGMLVGAEIHGFHTDADLNIAKLMENASTRWFRPNEVHAILSNYTCFKIQPQPIDNPPSGSVLLFDRKMLRNFRKDGHNWKKKKDGKTVQEAHEKLKIGNEERIHVYYARSEDDSNFYRRCYWLLDKNLERFVLVHYRQTLEDNQSQPHPAPVESSAVRFSKNGQFHGSPSTSVLSHSEITGSVVISEEINSRERNAACTAAGTAMEGAEHRNHELLHDINTLDWADLVSSPTFINGPTVMDGNSLPATERTQNGMSSLYHDSCLPSDGEVVLASSEHLNDNVLAVDLSKNVTNGGFIQTANNQDCQSLKAAEFKLGAVGSRITDVISENVFLSQNSFEKWDYMNDDAFNLLDEMNIQTPISNDEKLTLLTPTCQSSPEDHIFNINDVSPGWAYTKEETKILVVGCFHDSCKNLLASNIYCVVGEVCVATEVLQNGVFRFTALPQPPGVVELFLTLDGRTPISQVLSFEYRSSSVENSGSDVSLPEEDSEKLKWDDHELRTRLAHLLFKSTDSISMLSYKVPPKSLEEAKRFQQLTSPLLEKNWMKLQKLGGNHEALSLPASQLLLEFVLQNKLQEWLLEKIADGCKATPRDSLGQGVIHLCAMLDYAWAVQLFSLSGLSLDFRDAHGWTALHWAAHYGREKMVAVLLSAGANPSLVSDPTPEFPGGCIPADLASKQGHEGLAAYLAEKGLTAHFQAMSLSGNAKAPKTTSLSTTIDQIYDENLSEQELCLKESLAAYRNAADAADRIQAAFRERALKLQTRNAELAKPEPEAAEIVAALKIQHAFRNYNRRKLMKAAARIQSKFRTWKTRRDFLHMRRQVIKIQAAFRGHQVRKQYKKIVWSVGVLEKAILRWRLKRKGLRGMQSDDTQAMKVNVVAENTGEEEFYRISREQAEERVQRSVVKVQSMFRSYQAQQEYRRMKLAYEQAKFEFDELGY